MYKITTQYLVLTCSTNHFNGLLEKLDEIYGL